MNAFVAPDRFDARPVRPVSSKTLWDLAVARRDDMAAIVRRALEEQAIDALVLVSQTGNYPPWIKLEAWLPVAGGDGLRERAELEFVIDVRPYNEHTLVVTARLTRGRRSIAVNQRVTFSDRDVAEWTLYALDRGHRPSNYTPVRDAILAFIPFVHGQGHNPVGEHYRNAFGMTGAKALGIASALLAYFGFSALMAQQAEGGIGLLLGVAGLIAAAIIVGTRRKTIAVPSEPATRPRDLRLVDSWHTIVSGLWSEQAALMQRLSSQIGGMEPVGITCRTETYSYRTVNGYEERERMVVAKDQSMVHVHLHPFGNDLFAGWHAYLNWAGWGETKALTHRVEAGIDTEFRDLRPSRYVPSQFDLIDLNGLSDLVHRHLERAIKQALKERNIDQEIDFEIVRGDRARSLDRSRNAPEPAARRFWSRVIQPGWQQRSQTEIARVATPAPAGAATPESSAQRAAIGFAIWGLIGYLGTQQIREALFSSSFRTSSNIMLIAAAVGILTALVPAVAVAFGVRRYGGASLRHAFLALIAVVALSYGSGTLANIGVGAVMPIGELFRSNLYYLFVLLLGLTSGLSIFVVLAFFMPYFRQAGILTLFLLLWAGGSVLVLWLQRSGALASTPANIAYAVVRAIVFAAMGHWFHRAAAARSS